MRRPLRFVVGAERVLDLEVDPAPGATVGDLADQLAARTGGASGMTLTSRWPTDERSTPPPRDAPLNSHGPRAGSTAQLVPAAATAPSPRPSPARLVGADRAVIRLDYGSTAIDGVLVEVGDHVSVRSLGGAAARLDGAPVLGSARLRDGDLLTLAGRPWTVCVDGPLRPPPPRGWTRPHRRRPVAATATGPAAVTLPTPPAEFRAPGFPVLSATVPLLMAVALWVATGSLLSAAFMVASVVFVVASGLEARREARAEDRARVREFRADLDDALAQLDERAATQRRQHEAEGLTPFELREVLDPDRELTHPRVWERTDGPAGPPALTARLGIGTRPLQVDVVVPTSGRRVLRRELEQLAAQRAAAPDVVTVDLAETGGLVVEGADEVATSVARSVVLQLAALVGPDDLGLVVLAPGGRAQAWRDSCWLPHRLPGRRPQWLIVGDGADPTELVAAIDRLGAVRTTVVWTTPHDGQRPLGIGATLRTSGAEGELHVERTDGTVERLGGIALEPLALDESEPLARGLAGLVPAAAPRVGPPTGDGRQVVDGHGGLPDEVRLRDVVATPDLVHDPRSVAERWALGGRDHLATPVGVDEHGGTVDLDLVHDGPHALVAGTTGAGKSELLRTWLVAAALHHSPDRLQLLLIDYKGGAAFGPLSALPHTVGTITDLTGALAARALVALRAELRRREEAVAAAGADRWAGAALMVVVDELATLVAEQPDFVDGLVDLAQRGRSLGIHLVLATQRPAGVVTEAIRANATMRLALRVADEDDSRDVVDSPAAAHLPRQLPGRAVVRLGPARIATIQVAHSGGRSGARPPVVLHPLGDPHSAAPDVGDGPSDLEVAVATALDAATLSRCTPPRRPWVDPPAERIAWDELADPGVSGPARPGAVVLGVVDRPDLQRHEPLVVDLERDGGLLVLGASGSGRSTAVRTLVAQVHRDPYQAWHVHLIDGGSRLDDLLDAPAVGDVVGVHDLERVLRLLRSTAAEVTRRSRADDRADLAGAPRRLLVVDGIAAMEERYERLDRGVAMELLARIARDGRSVGVHVALTAHRRVEVPPSLAGSLAARIVLRCATADDASALGLDDAAADPDLPPGRCRVDGHVAQIAMGPSTWTEPTDQDEAPGAGPPPGPVPRLPARVDRARLDPGTDDGLLAIGLDGDTLATAHLDLRHHHGIVAGPPRSGTSTTLAAIAAAHPGTRLLTRPAPDQLAAAAAAAVDRARLGELGLLLVDDVADLLDSADGDAMAATLAELVTAGRELPVRLVLGGEVESLTRCYHEVVATVRRGRTGVVLGSDPELHGAVLHASITGRSDLPPAPGRGWMLGPGSARPVQVAAPAPEGRDDRR